MLIEAGADVNKAMVSACPLAAALHPVGVCGPQPSGVPLGKRAVAWGRWRATGGGRVLGGGSSLALGNALDWELRPLPSAPMLPGWESFWYGLGVALMGKGITVIHAEMQSIPVGVVWETLWNGRESTACFKTWAGSPFHNG